MLDLRLRVNGLDYGGWKSARVTRGIECVAGGFELTVSDRWSGRDVPWPIVEEDACELLVGDDPLVTGFVDRRALAYSATDRSLSVQGRDRTAALVDCSVNLSRWEFLGIDVLSLARKLCAPFGITVTMQTPLRVPPALPKVAIDVGETAWDALERACRMAGVLAVSDGRGDLVLTRAGTARATTALVRGENIITGAAEYDASSRFRRYVVTGQKPGTDEDFGLGASSVRGEAQDATVRRAERVLFVRAEAAATVAFAKSRAQWEATVRAGRARPVTYRVQGWTQADGTLWPMNALVPVRDAWLGVEGDMLIVQATHSIDDSGGTVTELALKDPKAFTPEPVLKESGIWAELR